MTSAQIQLRLFASSSQQWLISMNRDPYYEPYVMLCMCARILFVINCKIFRASTEVALKIILINKNKTRLLFTIFVYLELFFALQDHLLCAFHHVVKSEKFLCELAVTCHVYEHIYYNFSYTLFYDWSIILRKIFFMLKLGQKIFLNFFQ